MILSGDEIEYQSKRGTILIDPSDPSAKQPNGWEVRLGPWWFEPNPSSPIYRPWNKESQRDYWNEPRTPNYDGGKAIGIQPRSVILAHSIEWIGALSGYVPYLRCRSGVARSSATLCACAGFGEVGYAYRWTFEIENRTNTVMVIPVGARVGQVVFSPLDNGARPAPKLYEGSYGKTIDDWTPWDMVSRLHNDPEKDRFSDYVSPEEWAKVRRYRESGPIERLQMFGRE